MDGSNYSRKCLKRAWLMFLVIAYDITIAFKSLAMRMFIGCWPSDHHLLLKLLSDPNKGLPANSHSQVGPGLERLEYKDQAGLLPTHVCLVDDWDVHTVLRHKGVGWISQFE